MTKIEEAITLISSFLPVSEEYKQNLIAEWDEMDEEQQNLILDFLRAVAEVKQKSAN